MKLSPMFVRHVFAPCAIVFASRAGALVLEAPADSAAAVRVNGAFDPSPIDERLREAHLVRMQLGSGRWRIRQARATAEGLRFSDGYPEFGSRELEPRLVAWSEIERLDVGHSQVGRGAAIGAMAGLAGASIWFAIHPPKSDAGFLRFGLTSYGKAVLGTLLSTACGATLGVAVGDRIRRWETVYARGGPRDRSGRLPH